MTVAEAIFFMFDFSLELAVALGALIGLTSFQVYYITNRLKIKKPGKTGSWTRPVEGRKKAKAERKTAETDTAPNQNVIQSELFKKFQNNLNRETVSESPSAEQSEEEDVIVSISSKSAKSAYGMPGKATAGASSKTEPREEEKNDKIPPRKVVEPSPGAKKPPVSSDESIKSLSRTIKVDPIGSLFDDIQEPLEAKAEQNENPEETEMADQNFSGEQPISSNEFLTSKDLEIASEDLEDSIDLIISTVRKQFEAAKTEDALNTIIKFLQNEGSAYQTSGKMLLLLELKADIEFELEQFSRASKTIQQIFANHVTKNSPDFLPTLEKYINKFNGINQQSNSIHLMFTALNEYRQLHDHSKMDVLYDEIEIAYRQSEDWPRLIQTYQNHLSIKKVLKDYVGQLDLLDHLGKLLYDQGEEDKSRKCYEQRLVIENEMQRAGIGKAK